MTAPALLTEEEAATRLKLCARILRKARQIGALPYVKFGRSIRYTESDLARFIESARQCQSSPAPARRTSGTRSTSTVFDFEEARSARRAAKP
jgi:excisionase family DNA binding protein